MKCYNCGAEIDDKCIVCPVCGKSATEDEYLYASYVSKIKGDERRRKNNIKKVLYVLASVVIILALILGTYTFANNHHNRKAAPSLSFTSGTGIVNDEKVVYLTITDSSAIQYIHGVNIYKGEVDAGNVDSAELISSDYEYTKDSNDSIRAIFFYADDLGVKKGKDYEFTFEMTFGFSMDVNNFTYYQPVSISGDIKADLSNVVFDHKMNDDIENDFYVSTTESTTQVEEDSNYDFMLDYYWYSEPRYDGNTLSIDVWKFNKDKAVCTVYTKKGDGSWSTKNKEYIFFFDGTNSSVKSNYGNETYNMKPDSLSRTIEQRKGGETVSTLSPYKNNSIQNVEDIFGM